VTDQWLTRKLFAAILASQLGGWLGVTISPHEETLTVEDQQYPCGARIDSVVPDGPAESGGLRVGDVVVGVEGVELPATMDQFTTLFKAQIGARDPGEELTLIVVRADTRLTGTRDGTPLSTDELDRSADDLLAEAEPGTEFHLARERSVEVLSIPVVLGAPPAEAAGTKRFPQDLDGLHHFAADSTLYELMFQDAKPLARQLLEKFAATEDYADQRARLAKLAETGDHFRRNRVAYAMREPFALPALGDDLGSVPATLPEIIDHAAIWLDLRTDHRGRTTPFVPPAKLKVGLGLVEHAQQIEQVLAAAHAHYEAAFANLSQAERQFLNDHLEEMGDAFREDVMILRGQDKDRLERIQRIVALSTRVDMNELVAATEELARLVEPEYIAGLRVDLATKFQGISVTHESPYGKVYFAGGGDTWFPHDAAVIIDLGGDDHYTGPARQPFCIIIDLAGDDRYASTDAFGYGGGRLGISMIYDAEGDDVYTTRTWSLGAGALGVGIVLDVTGDDTYRSADYAQGAGFCGIGLLIDESGDDRYDAPRFAQGLGMVGGFGGLIDRGGNDDYFCSGRDLGAYGTRGIFAGWGQGCAAGFRSVASGGIALLLDEAGNDTYEAGNFSQGGGYYFGFGALIDRAGDDEYLGARYGQAFAAHQAVGYLQDDAGDDRYQTLRGVGQSCSWDETVTALIDRAGNDWYSNGGFALCASAHNGWALFLDGAGRDTYVGQQNRIRSGPNDYHGGSSFSLFLDLGGEPDQYGDPAVNNTVHHAPTHGFFLDVPQGIGDARQHLEEWIKKE
jgi:hypothetical protein